MYTNFGHLSKEGSRLYFPTKPNYYQSLHTTVFTDNGEIVEFQFASEMHDEAEFGIAAHWHYDESGSKYQKDLRWAKIS